MWCDNCLLLFPLRAGAMVLGTLMAAYQLGGGFFLIKFGNIFFTMLYSEANIYCAIAMAQGALALLALAALGTRSYVFSRFVFLIYPIVILCGAIRAGAMIYSINHHRDRIQWTCDSPDRISWIIENESAQNGLLPPSQYSYPQIPAIFCNIGVACTISIFTTALLIDFALMCYFLFLIWRFTVRLVHYPIQKDEFVYP